MAIDHDVPFVANSADDMHCFQASLSMLLRFFLGKRLSFAELDLFTGHIPGNGTWPLQGLQYLRSKGIDTLLITPFDYEEFVRDGVEYIRRQYGDEIAQWQDENNDLKSDQENIAQLLPGSKIEKRNPSYEDILTYIQNYPVMCSINSAVTRDEEGYTGHFVVIRGCDDNGLFLNDPGLPGRENVYIDKETFISAWDGFSDENSRFLYPVVGVSGG